MYKETGKAIENLTKKSTTLCRFLYRETVKSKSKNHLGRCPDTRFLKVDKL